MGKAKAITIAIDAMDDGQRNITPSLNFGSDFNTLRDAVENEFPEIGSLMPPRISSVMDYPDLSDATFGEIRTYAEQIFQMLGGLDG